MKKRVFLVAFLFCFHSSLGLAQESKIDFWGDQKRGANLFNKVETPERLTAAKKFGIQVVRLAPNKWLNGRPSQQEGDFLIGRPHDQFKALIADDLVYLKKVLDDANRTGLKVVLTMLSLPGSRWKQHNQGVEDRRIWQDFAQQEAAVSFWKQLAFALKDHPAIVGYNIRNEPSPELTQPIFKDWFGGNYALWYKGVKNTPADLNLFYRKIIKGIREVDLNTPIIVDSGFYATAWGFKIMEAIPDDKIIYSFHMYEPYAFTSRLNQGKYKYPGKAPIGESSNPPLIEWNKRELENYLKPISEWQDKYQIPSNRIFVGEVGVYRTNSGAEAYLRDTLQILNQKKWHWAFYSFREDTWAGMDYELGTGKPGRAYWQAIEKGKAPDESVYKSNPLSELLKAALK